MFYDRKFRRKMRKLTIYIARHRHSTAHSAHSEPCSHCAKEIKRFGIKKIVYVDDYGEIACFCDSTGNYMPLLCVSNMAGGYNNFLKENELSHSDDHNTEFNKITKTDTIVIERRFSILKWLQTNHVREFRAIRSLVVVIESNTKRFC